MAWEEKTDMEGQANNHGLQGFSVKRVIYLPRGYQRLPGANFVYVFGVKSYYAGLLIRVNIVKMVKFSHIYYHCNSFSCSGWFSNYHKLFILSIGLSESQKQKSKLWKQHRWTTQMHRTAKCQTKSNHRIMEKPN